MRPPSCVDLTGERLDLEALAILGHVRLAISRTHLPNECQRALNDVALDVIQRPLILRFEPEVRLRHDRLAIAADKAEILDAVGKSSSRGSILPKCAVP